MTIHRGLIIAIAAAGCRAPPPDPAPCSTVAGRFVAVARAGLEGGSGDDAVRRAALDQLPNIRDELARLCHEGQWSPEVRACMVKADDQLAFTACQRLMTDPQRAALDRSETSLP